MKRGKLFRHGPRENPVFRRGAPLVFGLRRSIAALVFRRGAPLFTNTTTWLSQWNFPSLRSESQSGDFASLHHRSPRPLRGKAKPNRRRRLPCHRQSWRSWTHHDHFPCPGTQVGIFCSVVAGSCRFRYQDQESRGEVPDHDGSTRLHFGSGSSSLSKPAQAGLLLQSSRTINLKGCTPDVQSSKNTCQRFGFFLIGLLRPGFDGLQRGKNVRAIHRSMRGTADGSRKKSILQRQCHVSFADR